MDRHEDIEIIEEPKRDKGFTLIELLIVIAILGILSTIVVLSVRGITDRGQSSACASDKKTLEVAYEADVAKGNIDPTVSPAVDVTAQLVTDGMMHSQSAYYQVDSAGTITVKTGVTKCA